MALQTTVSLQLLLTADDQISTILKAVQEQVDTLAESLSGLGDVGSSVSDDLDTAMGTLAEDVAATTEAVDTLTESLTTTAEQAAAIGVATETAAEQATGAITDTASAVTAAGDTFAQLDAVISAVLLRVGEQFTGLTTEMQDAMATAVTQVVSDTEEMGSVWGTTFEQALSQAVDLASTLGAIPVTFADMSASLAELNAELQATAGTTSEVATNLEAGAQAATTAAEAAATHAASSAESATTGGGMPYGGMLMRGGMGAMMGYFGLNMLANAGQFYGNLQQMMAVNNMASAQAGQAMAMLGAGGVSSAGSASYLRGISGNLRTEFTPQIGTGMLSKNAILLQSLGITQQDVAQSPWQLLQTIGGRYRGLMGSGQGQAASQLLGLTGTQQMASLFQNWSAVQRQTTGIVPNMTAKQVQQHAQQGLTMQESMVKLSMAFDQLATSLIPLVTPLVHAFTALVDGLTGAKSPAQVIKDLSTQLKTAGGEFVAVVIGLFAALKVGKMFKVIPSMTVTAGVVNVNGGIGSGSTPGGGVSPGIPGAAVPGDGAGAVIATDASGTAAADAASGGVTLASALDSAVFALTSFTFVLAGVYAYYRFIQATAVPHAHTPLGFKISGGPHTTALPHNLRAAQEQARLASQGVHQFVQQVQGLVGTNRLAAGATLQYRGSLANLAATLQAEHVTTTQATRGVNQWHVSLTPLIAAVQQTTASTTQAAASSLRLHAGLTPLIAGFGHATTGSQAASAQITAFAQRTRQHLATWSPESQAIIAGATQQWRSTQSGWSQQSQASFHSWSQHTLKTTQTGLGTISNVWRGWLGQLQQQTQQTASTTGTHKGPGTSQQVTSWLEQALNMTHMQGKGWLPALQNMARMESSNNPNAVNSQATWYSQKYGYQHAKGLMQMMGPTFSQYALPGLGSNIFNPVQNAAASIRYILAQYGSPWAIPGVGGGSSYRGYARGGLITEPIVGHGMHSGSGYLFGEAGPEWIVPHGAGGGAGGGSMQLTVNVQAATSNPRALAQQVATELTQMLKRRGNFAF